MAAMRPSLARVAVDAPKQREASQSTQYHPLFTDPRTGERAMLSQTAAREAREYLTDAEMQQAAAEERDRRRAVDTGMEQSGAEERARRTADTALVDEEMGHAAAEEMARRKRLGRPRGE